MSEQPTFKKAQYYSEDMNTSDNDAQSNADFKSAEHFTEAQFIEESQMSEQQLESLLQHSESVDLNSAAKAPSKLTRLVLALLLMLVGVQTTIALLEAFNASPWLFGFYSVVLTVVMIWGCRAGFNEYRKLKSLRKVTDNQQVASRLQQSMQTGEADKFIATLCQRNVNKQSITRYFNAVSQEHNDAEKLVIFEQTVLIDQDQAAKQVVSRFAAESAVLLAASPLAMLDMAIILWRNQKMITDIANIYGIELGYWSRIKLIRSIVVNIIYAGSTEVMADLGTQMMSMEMTGKLSTRVAQGLGGGLLTARLGYQAMRLCRPIAFNDDNRPKLRKIYQQLLGELKQFSRQVMGNVKQEELHHQSTKGESSKY
ncbi:YcjF family protein [Shewanella maritima]|uniref:YcjF family protein n=1 Tax=Shewanella maritima TaxID=2520507 RepID=UPI0037366026